MSSDLRCRSNGSWKPPAAFLSVADLSLPPTDRFNVSWQETWGFGFRFRRGDHKAVKRCEPPRSCCGAEASAAEYYQVITIRYSICAFCGRKIASDAARPEIVCLWRKCPAVAACNQTLPTVFSRARGWISAWDKTMVWARKRSTSERTNGRIAADVTSTGASPSRAACSNRSRTTVMNSESFE